MHSDSQREYQKAIADNLEDQVVLRCRGGVLMQHYRFEWHCAKDRVRIDRPQVEAVEPRTTHREGEEGTVERPTI